MSQVVQLQLYVVISDGLEGFEGGLDWMKSQPNTKEKAQWVQGQGRGIGDLEAGRKMPYRET